MRRPWLDGYRRAIFFERETGYVVDLGERHMANAATPEESLEYFETGRGDAITKRRAHVLSLDVTDPVSTRHLDLMKRATDGRPGSPRLLGVEAILLGYDKHTVWYEPTALGLTSIRQGFGGFAPVQVRMVSNVFEPSIWQDESLIHGAPWHRQDAIYNDELDAYILPGPSGFEGPFWRVSSSAEVDIMGELSSGTATLDIVAPIGGAKVRLGPAAGLGVTTWLRALDFEGDELDRWRPGAEALLPPTTWRLRITLASAIVQPRLQVVHAGHRQPPRVGGQVLT